MKTLNPFQVEQMVFDTIPLGPDFLPTFGNLPIDFQAVVFGDSGNGKTEFVMQFVKALCLLGIKVDWISYEQGHGLDIQQAIKRNQMIEVRDNFKISDPESKDDDISYFSDLENKIKKRGSYDLFVIDSLQYTRFTFDDYKYFKKKYKDKKAFIWISHRDGKFPLGKVAKDIAYDGGLTILVDKFIAKATKTRFGGWEPYIVFEQRARLLNPKFFLERDNNKNKSQNTPEITENDAEEMGVDAHD